MWEATITNIGNRLLGKIMGGTGVVITKAKSGNGTVNSDVLKSQTTLVSEKQLLKIDCVKSVGESSRISVLLSNEGLNQSYVLNQIGFYANDPDYGEILFAIAQNTEEKTIPKETESPMYSISYNFHFSFSGSEDITAEVEPDSYVTNATLNTSNENLIDAIKAYILEEKKKEYHVGKLIFTENSANPASYLGFGSWQLYGSGRVPVGFNGSDSDFNQIGKTGGEKKHTLSAGEIAAHTHSIPKLTGSAASAGAHTHTTSGTATSAGAHTHYGYWSQNWCASGERNSLVTVATGGNNQIDTGSAITKSDGAHTHKVTGSAASAGAHTHTITTNEGKTGSTGSGTAHNNLQPYFVCYIWKRVS